MNSTSINFSEFKNKKILITGGSTGIGAALAKAFAKQGAIVGLHYLSSVDAANQVASEIRSEGGSVELIKADASDSQALAVAVKEAAERQRDAIFQKLAKEEEERRLAYVGITRAKYDLNLSYASSRYTYGINNYSLPSRFLSEIKSINLEETDYIDNQSDIDKPKLLSSDNIALSPGKKRMMEFLNKHKK